MTNNESRGLKNDPNDRIDRPQGQRCDATAGEDSVARKKDRAGAGAPPLDEYQFSTDNKARTRGVATSTVDDVFDALLEYFAGRREETPKTVTSTELKTATSLSKGANQIGKALRELANTDDCPVHVELWGGAATTPMRWEVSLPTDPVGVPPTRLHYASGTKGSRRALHIDKDCQRLASARSKTSTPATHPPRGELCVACAPDLSMDDLGPDADVESGEEPDPEIMTDGGTIDPARSEPLESTDVDRDGWYIMDADRSAVVAGPYEEKGNAIQRSAIDYGPEHAVVAGDRIAELDESETTLIWELEDVHVITDGGTVDGAIDNDFDDAELSAREQLEQARPETPTAPVEGGIAYDLVTQQPLFVRRVLANDLVEYYVQEEFDLLNYGVHPYLPVTIDDRALECVFLSDITAESLGSFESSKTYDYPEGRLAHVPVEQAWTNGGGG